MSQPLVAHLIERCQKKPQDQALVFVNNQGLEELVTLGRLHDESLTIAQELESRGVASGEVVLLVMPYSRALIAAFWGCLYLGAIPAILPETLLNDEVFEAEAYQAEGVGDLIQTTQAKAIVVSEPIAPKLSVLLADGCCQVLGLPTVVEPSPREVLSAIEQSVAYAQGTQPFYLQHTSGTTGSRKSVSLSHDAVAHCLDGFIKRLSITQQDVIISWLPLYHDYGLFAGLVLPLVLGIPLVLLSPFTVVRRPETFLWAIHNHRGTLSWIFNSGYHIIAQNIRDKRLTDLDLSSLRALACGGEPVRPDSQRLFLERLAPFGLRESAIIAGYGLAETVMSVTCTPAGEPNPVDWVDTQTLLQKQQAVPCAADDPEAMGVVCLGPALEGSSLCIADTEGMQQPDRHVGELLIRGQALFSRYFGSADDTPDAMSDEGWFHTGDLGYLVEGNLYFCGRKKDLIIVGGRNIHPQHLEAMAADIFGDNIRRVLAFGIDTPYMGTELPVVVCEPRRTIAPDVWETYAKQFRQQVQAMMAIALADVRLVPRRWIEVTTSGKLARSATQQKYIDAGYDSHQDINQWPFYLSDRQPESIVTYLQTLFEAHLGLASLDPQASFIDLGISSLELVRLLTIVEESLGQTVQTESLMSQPTLTHLARLLGEAGTDNISVFPGRPEREDILPDDPANHNVTQVSDSSSQQGRKSVKVPRSEQPLKKSNLPVNCDSLPPSIPPARGEVLDSPPSGRGWGREKSGNVEPSFDFLSTSAEWLRGAIQRTNSSTVRPPVQRVFSRIHRGPTSLLKAIPYSLGTQLLSHLTRPSPLQQQLYQTQIDLLHQCLETVDVQDVTETIQQNLMVNSWVQWRTQTLSQPQQFSRWVTLKGITKLESLIQKKQGVIIAIPHTKLKELLWHLPMLQTVEMAAIGNLTPELLMRIGLPDFAQQAKVGIVQPEETLHLTQLHRAQQVLRQGGVTIIAPYETRGEGGITIPFYGHWRTIRPGMAELAVQTGAAIVPTFVAMSTSGGVTIEFRSPLMPRAVGEAQQIKDLLYQYAQILTEQWPYDLGALQWYILQAFLQSPKVDASTRV
ncbi:MAG: AMP-binding protein [Chloroflexota bacterium]